MTRKKERRAIRESPLRENSRRLFISLSERVAREGDAVNIRRGNGRVRIHARGNIWLIKVLEV